MGWRQKKYMAKVLHKSLKRKSKETYKMVKRGKE